MHYKTWIEISKANLLHNVGQFLSLLPKGAQFMAVVKSNAYGHGLKEITHTIRNSRFIIPNSRLWFGVDNLNEAAMVRDVAPRNSVLVLGYTQNERLLEAAKLGVRITVYNWETLHTLEKLNLDARRCTLYAHIKVETGTTRQGVPEAEVVKYIKELKKLKGIEVEGISTHFANIEDTASPEYARSQLTRYNSVIERLKQAGIDIPVRHMACSAATLLYPQTYGNLVRVGIGMYGLWPSKAIHTAVIPANAGIQKPGSPIRSGMTKPGIVLKPVLTWKTMVAQVKEVKKGTPVSYGLTERIKHNSRVAVLPIGYWDGYDRGLSRIGQVLINGVRCKVLGRICMNMTMVDVTDAGHVRPEDKVVLIGRQGKAVISAEELAQKLNTINYEIVTRINPLLPRLAV